MAPIHLLSAVLLAVARTVIGALYSDPSQLHKTRYDFIVVGGIYTVLPPILRELMESFVADNNSWHCGERDCYETLGEPICLRARHRGRLIVSDCLVHEILFASKANASQLRQPRGQSCRPNSVLW